VNKSNVVIVEATQTFIHKTFIHNDERQCKSQTIDIVLLT